MIENVPPIGCIIISGSNTSLYKICGTEITQVANLDVNLPKKHGRGGQSQLRFSRLRDEARFNYVSKVIEIVLKNFGPNLPVVLGGVGSLKENLAQRLSVISTAPKIERTLDLQYDKKIGLYDALSNCHDLINSIQIQNDKIYISKFFDSLARADNMAVYGAINIDFCLQNNMIETLLIHEECECDIELYQDKCNNSAASLVILTSFLPEATQIKKGFGGIVGLLRYPVEPLDYDSDDSDEN